MMIVDCIRPTSLYAALPLRALHQRVGPRTTYEPGSDLSMIASGHHRSRGSYFNKRATASMAGSRPARYFSMVHGAATLGSSVRTLMG